MCIMCLEIAKGRMTVQEARRALPEMIDANTAEARAHYQELQKASDEELLKRAKQFQNTEKK
jgi:hypothetical protein